MKKKVLSAFVAAIILTFAGPAFSDSIQIWDCESNAGATGDALMKASKDWLDAAKSMDGGKDLQVILRFPEATNGSSASFAFVLIAPDLATWGLFSDGYQGSAAQAADVAFTEVAVCNASTLWTSVPIE